MCPSWAWTWRSGLHFLSLSREFILYYYYFALTLSHEPVTLWISFLFFTMRQTSFSLCLQTRDKSGKLALSPKQKAIFARWVRPDEICNNPMMIMSVSSFSIKQVRGWEELSLNMLKGSTCYLLTVCSPSLVQTVVSDCSFVASLAISAAYERRWRKKLITRYFVVLLVFHPYLLSGEQTLHKPCFSFSVRCLSALKCLSNGF